MRDPGRGRSVAVDLGTGSGAIALALAAERTGIEVWATDVSTAALAVAGANLAGLGGRAAARVRLATGSWWAALPDELRGRVDLAVSNPPYVARARDGRTGSRGGGVGAGPGPRVRPNRTRSDASHPGWCSGVAPPDGRGGHRDRPSSGRSGPGPGPGVRVHPRRSPTRSGRSRPQPGGQERPVTVVLDARRPFSVGRDDRGGGGGLAQRRHRGDSHRHRLRSGRRRRGTQGRPTGSSRSRAGPAASSCRCSSPARPRPSDWPPRSPRAPGA